MDNIIVNGTDITDCVTSFESYDEMEQDKIIGNAVSTQIKIKLKNRDNQLEGLLDYPFSIGNKTFIVYEKPEKWTKTVSATLYDKMILTNIAYDTKLEYPVTLSDQLDEMSLLSGVEIDKTTLSEDILSKNVNYYDNSILIRSYIGFIAQCDGKNAFIENDRIVFRKIAEELHTVDFCSSYELNELMTFTRSCYDDGINIIEKGDETGKTLYVSSDNFYIEQSDINRIYDLYNGLSFYSFKSFKCKDIEGIKLTHLITYHDITILPSSMKKKVNGGESRDSLELSCDISLKSTDSVEVSEDIKLRIKKIRTELNQNESTMRIIAEKQEDDRKTISELKIGLEGINTSVENINKNVEKLDLSSYQLILMKSGNVLTNSSGTITMECSVNHSGEDITESLDASAFNWQRSSSDSDSDEVWNNAHKGFKSITVTNDDVIGSASFSCTVDVTLSKTMRTAFETIVDETDVVRLGLYIDSNVPYTQSLGNDGMLYPSWTNTVLTPQVTDGAVQIDNSECTFEWKKRVGDGDDEALGDGETITDGVLKITKNVLSEANPVISYICYVDYKGNKAKQMLTFALALPGSEGKAGQDGQAKYTWIRYADDDKGTNMSDIPEGKSYIGIANNKNTDVKSDDPLDYVWSRIQGNSGRGMTGAKAYFALSTSNTGAPSGEYKPERPEVPEGQYLWQKIYFSYDDDTSEFTEAVCVTGVKGNGIKSKDITYQIWNDGITTPTGEWTPDVPETNAEMTYLWTRIILTYDDDTTSTFYSVGSTPAGLEQEINDSINSAVYELSESFSSSFDELDDSITQKVNRIEELTNTNTGDIEAISKRVTGLTLEDGAVTIMINNIAEKLGGYYTKEEIQQWMRFDNGELSLGASNSDFQSVLSRDKLAFKQSNTEVAWISNKQLHIKEAVIEERIIMDPFILEIDDNGFVIR